MAIKPCRYQVAPYEPPSEFRRCDSAEDLLERLAIGATPLGLSDADTKGNEWK